MLKLCIVICVPLLTVLCCGALLAQSGGTITANPNAVRLHEIWRVEGQHEQEYVGNGAGALGDINGDSIADFAVKFHGQWRIFFGSAGAPSTTAAWTYDGTTPQISHPIVGNFFGTGEKAIGFMNYVHGDSLNPSIQYYQLYFYKVSGGKISGTPDVVIDPHQAYPSTELYASDITVSDIDGDGSDDVIWSVPILRRNKVRITNPEVWIYRGGSSFGADTPTVIIKDTQPLGPAEFFTLGIGDYDNDGAVDILTGADYSDSSRLKFYWGSASTPWAWNQTPRVVTLTTLGHPRVRTGSINADCDGDRVPDLWLTGPDGKVYLYRSHGTDKSLRTRTLALDDADAWFYRKGYTAPVQLGSLNDSTGRYQMLGLLGVKEDNPSVKELLGFASGPSGPDAAFDVSYDDGLDNPFMSLIPTGDINADGWDDLLCTNSEWFGGYSYGIALILAGGPYIPTDPSAGVEELAVTGRSAAISVWPNPVRDALHIAWRGDLKRMPSRVIVSDLQGRELTSGGVEAWRGEAVWTCGTVPAGTYLVSLYDDHDMLIRTFSVVKQ